MASQFGYAEHADVSNELRTGTFSGSTTPTSTVVEDLISQSEREINKVCNHAWASVTVSNEYYYFGGVPRVRVTYAYGESTVDHDIETATIYLTCAKVLRLIYQPYPEPSGERLMDAEAKIRKYKEDAYELINRHRIPADIANNQYSPRYSRWIYLNHKAIRSFTPGTHKIEIADLVTNGTWTDIVQSSDYEEATTPNQTNKDYYIDYAEGKILFLKSSLIGTRWF